MNKVVASLPPVTPGCYAALAPKWFTYLARLITLLFCSVILVASIRSWDEMPLLAQILVVTLTTVFLIVAIHPRGWARLSMVPFVFADAQGMYVPSSNARVLGRKYEPRWLFVPWENVFNLRVATLVDSEGRQDCGAMDVRATDAEVQEFFYVGLEGEQSPEPDCVPVAFYCNIPPRAKTVVGYLKQVKP
ncbi:MAG: hypothetical protein VYA55_20700 [Pseudomonadota bacterium]|nr:hypothetical protein [Pseudomonadota bacterium]